MWRATPADPDELFGADELDRSRRYRRPLTRLRIGHAVLGVVVAVGIVAAELGPHVVAAFGDAHWVVQLVGVLVALEVVRLVVDLPFTAWTLLGHDRRWGLSTQTTAGLVADEVKGLLVSLVFGLVVLVPTYALARTTAWWWLWAWGVLALAVVVGGLVVPVVVAPLFSRFVELDDPDLLGRVEHVAGLADVAIGRVEVADESRRSRRDNAYVAGFGPTRRVVLFDTLLESPPELVEQVVAHELGHVRRHHVVVQVALVSVLLFVVMAVMGAVAAWTSLFDRFGVSGFADPAGLPLAVLVVEGLALVAGPVLAWTSRVHERTADQEALELLGRPDLVEDMLRRLHLHNLADLAPGRWSRLRATHPPVAERIAFARRWALGPGRLAA